MTQTTPTCLWNDSASESELAYAIDNGAVGATCNPVIVLSVVRQEMSRWQPRLAQLVDEQPGRHRRRGRLAAGRRDIKERRAAARPYFRTGQGA